MPETSLVPLSFENQPIRAEDGAPSLWVAEDVCAALGISKHRDAIAKLDDDERGSLEVDTPGGRQVVAAVTEAGVYTLALRCRDAMTPGTAPYRFRKWVTGVALPALRRGSEPGIVHGIDRTVMAAIGGTVKKVVTKALAELVPAMVHEYLTSHRLHVVEGVSALEVLEIAGFVRGKRPRGMAQFASAQLARYHEDRQHVPERSRHGSSRVRLFNEGLSRRWLASGGSHELDSWRNAKLGVGQIRLRAI